MDSVTHIFLGGALAQWLAGRRVGQGRAFLLGALAATIPDFDLFFHTGNAMQDHALHRHFMHALVMVPLLAALAVLPFLFHKKSRPMAWPLYGAALVACASHTLLDVLTSYGTMIFWPFTERRFALDIIAVVDPLYTVPLILGVVWAWRRKSAVPAVVALMLSCLYLGVATIQHGRAVAAQRELLAARQVVAAENPRVLPQVGAVVSYRSIYIAGGVIHADAIRVPVLGTPTFKAGGTLPRVTFADLQGTAMADAKWDFAMFEDMADGFVARSPMDPLLISDERYTYYPEGLDPVWGLQLEQTGVPLFRITPRWNYVGRLVRDLFRPKGYAAIPPAIPLQP